MLVQCRQPVHIYPPPPPPPPHLTIKMAAFPKPKKNCNLGSVPIFPINHAVED